jgi:hypothetical protein
LLAKAVCQIQIFDLTCRFREQAHSHRYFGCTQIPANPQITCGSGLVCEGIVSDTDFDLTRRFREQAHSHRFFGCTRIPGNPQISCGSGLAREGSVSDTDF